MAQQQRNLPEIFGGTRMSPFREMARLQRSMDRLFEDMMTPLSTSLLWPSRSILEEPVSQGFMPPVDIEETDNRYLLNLDLPGVTKNEISIEITDHHLVVRGERKIERVEEKGIRHSVERCCGVFQRTFTLPVSVNVDQIQAHFENGVLSIAIPKVEAAHRKSIEIIEGRVGEGVIQPTTKVEKKEKAA